MQGIENVTLERLLDQQLPFTPFLPTACEYFNLTYRPESEKWSSVRYNCNFKGNSLRVKIFFMDWFFTGFPKSLMKNFRETYSKTNILNTENGVLFAGKNYRGRDSSTFYRLGSTVEIESDDPMPDNEFLSFVNALRPYNARYPAPGDLSFSQRSFICRSGDTGWFEETRIRRLDWRKHDAGFKLGHLEFTSSGKGELKADPGEHYISIFEDAKRNFSIWVEYLRNGSMLKFGTYSLEGNSNFYTLHNKADFPGEILIAGKLGPMVAQTESSGGVFTIAFSPGIGQKMAMKYLSESMFLLN